MKRLSLRLRGSFFNIDDKIMYFGIGGHPAIRVNYEDNDTKGNYVLFVVSQNADKIEENFKEITK